MQSNKKLLYQYAGFAIQLLVALGIATYAGLWIDKKLKLTIPLLIWMLPLLVLIMMILKTVKDTNKK
ncbi:MAG: hypothetical protein H7178_04365 [Chitinophagaceae bacterium]|nr:hypothetical protein [Chitinophagaceae bacterium]